MPPFRLGPVLLLMLLTAVSAGCWSPTQPEVPDPAPTPAPGLTPAPLRAAPPASSYSSEYAACMPYLDVDNPPETYGHRTFWKRQEQPVTIDGVPDTLPKLLYGSRGDFMALTFLRDGRVSVTTGSMIAYKFKDGPPLCMAPPGYDPTVEPSAPETEDPDPSELIGK